MPIRTPMLDTDASEPPRPPGIPILGELALFICIGLLAFFAGRGYQCAKDAPDAAATKATNHALYWQTPRYAEPPCETPVQHTPGGAR